MISLSLFQRLALRLSGYVYVGHRRHHGWRGRLPFYAFECMEHGIVVDYPHGFKDRLDCPKCNVHKKGDLADV